MAETAHKLVRDDTQFLKGFEEELGPDPEHGDKSAPGPEGVIRHLLELKADLHSDPIAPHSFIAKVDDKSLVQSLTDMKADISTAKESMHVARTKDKKLVQSLIKFKATVQIPAKASDEIIVRTDKPEVVKLLIDKKADVTPPKEGAVHSVVRTSNKDVVRYMIEQKVEVHCDPKSTVQFYAKLEFEKSLITTLTGMNADVQISKTDDTLLHLAVRGGGDPGVVNLLLDAQVWFGFMSQSSGACANMAFCLRRRM